jgi:hypothetical protein
MTSLFVNGQASTPSGLKVAPQSYATLEQVADQLREYLPLADGERFRIDCVRVLEQTFRAYSTVGLCQILPSPWHL